MPRNVILNAHEQRRSIASRVSDWISAFTGSWTFIILHVIWFAGWFAFKLNHTVLTLIVSLEAIFLASFILMVQNRQSQKDNARDEADYQADKRSEQEIQNVKRILISFRDDLQRKTPRRR